MSYSPFVVSLGSQPWAVAIRLQGNQKSFHWCGAVLISEFYVLTVAHCMEDYPKDVYRVRIGDWDMQVAELLKNAMVPFADLFDTQNVSTSWTFQPV